MEAADLIRDIQRAGFTQVQISAATGIPQPTISKVVRGEVRDVLSRSYRRLAELHARLTSTASEKQPSKPATRRAKAAA